MNGMRRAFTMIELLIAITIILILAAVAAQVLSSNRNTGKLRDAARIGQSAFLGAKDRALHAKDLRGVRLVRDTTDGTLVTGFTYLQPLPMQTYGAGSIQLERLDVNPQDNVADSADILIVRGFDQPANPYVDWAQKSQFFPNPFRIRIPSGSGGQWYTAFLNTSGLNAIGVGNEVLQLQTPFSQQPPPGPNSFPKVIAWPTASAFSSCDIQLGNDLLPFHQPISLPSAVVIDLKFSSANVQSLAGINTGNINYIDLMFSPRGMITGAVAAQGPLHFFLRSLDDATANLNFVDAQGNTGTSGYYVGTAALPDPNKSERLILTVFPQTGLVSTFEFDPTDANGDGLADNPFNLAQLGKSAGR